MQYILIFDGAIAGTTDDPDVGLPNGFQVYHYMGNEALSQLYWDGTKVLPKPTQPGPDYFWRGNKWHQRPTVVQAPPPQEQAVYASPLFAEAKTILEKEAPLIAALFMWVYAESLNDAKLVNSAKSQVESIVKQRKSVPTDTSTSNAPTSTNRTTTPTATTATTVAATPRKANTGQA